MQSSPQALRPEISNLLSRLTSTDRGPEAGEQVYHVDGVGARFYFAYEQLRNAAEYRERHLLLHGAIQRFLERVYVSSGEYKAEGAELVAELTQAGYLHNHSVPLATIKALDDIGQTYATYSSLVKAEADVSGGMVRRWVIEILSIQYENLLVPANRRLAAFMTFAYEHYLAAVDLSTVGSSGDEAVDRMALYCAVQRTVFKSDRATIRAYALAPLLTHQPAAVPPAQFVQANQLIDAHVQGALTNRLSRLIGRYAAPMRIMREMLVVPGDTTVAWDNKDASLARARSVIGQQYGAIQKTTSDRLIKSIIFILLTKVLIGVAVEVPYDIVRYQHIIWRPLLINIIFPPVYMMLIGLQIKAPGSQNTDELVSYIERILYTGDQPPIVYRLRRRVTSPTLNSIFLAVYALGFVISFGLVIWLLRTLGFNLVNGAIFFIFFSAVSFLGFRLRRVAGELRLLPERQNLLAVGVDFFSTPFVRVGHWISDRYARANIVTRVLDAAIELPLKTSLRVVRQWTGYMRDKQDEL